MIDPGARKRSTGTYKHTRGKARVIAECTGCHIRAVIVAEDDNELLCILCTTGRYGDGHAGLFENTPYA